MKKTIEQDMQALQGSFNELRVATSKFQESKNAIASFATQAPETEILVPLTSSLYIPGRVSDIENVIIDLGAGYFAEMPAQKAQEYCDRKITFVNDSVRKIGEIIDVKAHQSSKIEAELAKRIEEIQKQQKEAAH